MHLSITIPREGVFRQVARRTEWQGTRSPQDNDYDRLALSEGDKALFHSFFDEAAMHVIDICRPFLKSVSNTDEALELQLTVNSDADHGSMAKTMENMLVSHVLALWQEIVAPGQAATSFSRRDDYSSKIQSILYHHPAPQRQKPKEENKNNPGSGSSEI